MNNIQTLIENPHSVYSKNFLYWNFLLESYEGGMDYCHGRVDSIDASGVKVYVGGKLVTTSEGGNLFKHKKERDEDYKDRIKMSYYYNFCAPIIDIYTNHLFKEPIITDFKGINQATLDATENDIDRMGSSMIEMRKQIAELAQVYGHCYVVCDKPIIAGQVRTLRDKIDLKLFPYFTIYRPTDVLNWSLDEFGRPYWVLLRERIDANTDPFNYDASLVNACGYRLWTRNEWVIYDGKYHEVMRGGHTAGMVPITCFFDKKSKKEKNFLGISALSDIAFITRDIYNASSELREIIRNQTFAFLALQGTADEYKDISVGTSKGLLYPETRNAPQYVSPPPANAEVLFSHIDRQVHKIFQLAKLEGGTASAPTDQSAGEKSGVSKAWDFNETNSALSMKAGNMEDAETRLWQIFAAQDGGTFEGFVNYPTEFSIKDLQSDLNEAEQLMRINMGKEFNNEVKKAIIQKKFPRLPEDKLNKMIKDMEKTPEPGADSNGTRRFSFFNKNANSSGKNGGKEDGGRTERE